VRALTLPSEEARPCRGCGSALGKPGHSSTQA
jgi:hypothetical protein